jgi:hypothetical protein
MSGLGGAGGGGGLGDSEMLAQIESLCEKIYTAQSNEERLYADKTLASFYTQDPTVQDAVTAASDLSTITQHTTVLTNSMSTYAIHFSAKALMTMVTTQWSSISSAQRLELWNFVLVCIASKGTQLQKHATNALVDLLCRITKLAWCDDRQYHNVVDQVKSFMRTDNLAYKVLAFEIFHSLVTEMSTLSTMGGVTVSRNGRKASHNFRDQALRRILDAALSELHSLAPDCAEFGEGTEEEKLLGVALQTALQVRLRRCLCFPTRGTRVLVPGPCVVVLVHAKCRWLVVHGVRSEGRTYHPVQGTVQGTVKLKPVYSS